MAYDIFFLSYNEPNADANWAHLQNIAPHARRINGIKGLYEAHAKCASLARTKHFFVVDADSRITDPTAFDYKVSEYDSEYVHLWYSDNEVNDLQYGWGGLKLFPKTAFDIIPESKSVDMTTSFSLKIIPQVVSRTFFNATPYDAWRSAFREAAKLSSGVIRTDDENAIRLAGWKTANVTAQNAKWAIRGAYDGEAFALNVPDIQGVNDWSWLKTEFTRRYPDAPND